MRRFAIGVTLAFACLGSQALGETLQEWGVACLSKMETETSWPECRTGLFSPCAGEAVGSEGHLSCLAAQKKDWRVHLDQKTMVLNKKLTAEGAGQLSDLLGQWFGYVGNKCSEVAAQKAKISSQAAMLGCEISEFAGLATEFESCLSGNSVSPYCTLQE